MQIFSRERFERLAILSSSEEQHPVQQPEEQPVQQFPMLKENYYYNGYL